MNTPSKEALDAAENVQDYWGFPRRATIDLATIIDRHFEPLRKRLAEMESLLASEKATRNAIIAKGQQAEARVKELEATCAELVTDGNAVTLAANLAKQSARVNELAGALRNIIEIVEEDGSDERYDRAIAREAEIALDPSLARLAAGEPAIDSLLAVTPVYTTEMRDRLQKAADAVDAGEPEDQK